ncbi:MAG: DUF4192 domain-containing protein [Nocardioidaceae bacterium]
MTSRRARRTTTPEPPTRPTLVARCAEDLLAMVPVVLGFHPGESVVLMTFGAVGRSFHARCDLPRVLEDVDEVVDVLLEPVVRHDVSDAAVIAYADDELVADLTVHTLVEALEAVGVRVRDALRVTDGRWFRCFPDHPTEEGVPFDIGSHPFLADSVLRGEVTLESRDELRASVARDPVAAEAVARSLWSARPPLEPAQRPAEVAWALSAVDRALADPDRLTSAVLARLVDGLRDHEVRDHLCFALERPTAAAHVDLWTRVLRSAPEGRASGPAVLLAFAAWLAGNGALAWCALDRCFAETRLDSLALTLAHSLQHGLHPSVWDGTEGGGDPGPDPA